MLLLYHHLQGVHACPGKSTHECSRDACSHYAYAHTLEVLSILGRKGYELHRITAHSCAVTTVLGINTRQNDPY